MWRNSRMPHCVHHAALRRRTMPDGATRIGNNFLLRLFMRLPVLPEPPDFTAASRSTIYVGTVCGGDGRVDRKRCSQSQFRDARTLVATHPTALRSHPAEPSRLAVRMEQFRLLPCGDVKGANEAHRHLSAGFQILQFELITTMHPHDGLSVRRTGCHPLSS